MILIFLWGLVAALVGHGILKADEYGSAASMLGGMSLTMRVWGESLTATMRSLVFQGPEFTGLPRAFVKAAIGESARHPGLHTVPALRSALAAHERVWEQFRQREVTWVLRHSDMMGAFHSDPAAIALWAPASTKMERTKRELEEARSRICRVIVLNPTACESVAQQAGYLEDRLRFEEEVVRLWEEVLYISPRLNVSEFWITTQSYTQLHTQLHTQLQTPTQTPTQTQDASGILDKWRAWNRKRAELYNVTNPDEPRIRSLLQVATDMSSNLTDHYWLRTLTESLMNGELWNTCMDHVMAREGRVRELMTATGINDLLKTHDLILNASLRTVTQTEERRMIQDWFAEAANYAWWLGEDIPGIVRRCLAQTAGDCTRIGPTEIVTLTAQQDTRMRIVEDWSRRILIGLWNGLPAIGLILVLEVVLLCVDRRMPLPPPHHLLPQKPQVMILRLESADGQILGERQLSLRDQ